MLFNISMRLLFQFIVFVWIFLGKSESDVDRHIRHCILYEYDLGRTCAQALTNMITAYGTQSVSDRTVKRWFAKFRDGDRNLEDQPHIGRPADVLNEAIEQVLANDAKSTTREIADAVGSTHTTVEQHLAQMKEVSKLGCWVPHQLSPVQMQLNELRLACLCFLATKFNRLLT